MLEIVFWILLAIGIYPFVGYPLAAAGLSLIKRRQIDHRNPAPRSASIVIAAYNEAAHIEATVRNKLAQQFDGDLEIIVASDGSDDGTDAIVQSIASEDARVRLVRQEPRQGKTAALNRLVELTRGEIVVFSDANSIYRADTVALLVESFSDESVGYVTGKMVYVNADGSLVGDGCTAYMRYENWLRSVETRLGSVVGVDGGVDAVRRHLYRPMRADQLPDFVLPLTVIEQGRRVVYEPRAVLQEASLHQGNAEFRMRVRVALRAFWALRDKRRLLSGAAGGLFAWQLASHKLLRYLAFLPLALAALLNVVLATSGGAHLALLVAQALFWAAAWLGHKGVGAPGARYAYYFVLLNVASAVAFRRFTRGEKQVIWQPRTG